MSMTYTTHAKIWKYVTLFSFQSKNLLIMKSDMDVAQFQNQAPEYLPLSEEFWKALRSLPVAYDYAAYSNVLERFGTHYYSEGTLGGQFRLFIMVSQDILKKMSKWSLCHIFVSLLWKVVDDVIQDVSSNCCLLSLFT